MKRVALLGSLALASSVAHAQGVLTRSGDNARTGNYQDSQITVASLRQRGITLRTTIPVIGDARGTESQPLILSGVTVADGTTHDVMLLPSLANIVRGVDAHTGAGLWQTALGRPVDSSPAIDFHGINQHFGVLSTGVIDAETARGYLVDEESPDGTPQRGVHYLYTLDMRTGAVLDRASFATLRNGTQAYSAVMRKQRSSLLLATIGGRKTIFCAYGTVLEENAGAAGAIIAYDVATAKFSAFLPTSQGRGAGIWMAGQGLAADAQGYLYAITGNGSFNGTTDFGESVLKVRYVPPAGTAAASLKVVSWFSPYSDAGRIGLDPVKSGPAAASAKLAGVNGPDAAMPVGGAMGADMTATHTVMDLDQNTGMPVARVYPDNPTAPGWSDEDLGSAGGLLLDEMGFYLAGGKDGIAYLTRTANLGNTLPADFANPKANCAKLATYPVWATASPGPVDPCPQDVTTLNFMPWGRTRHLHMTPVAHQGTAGMSVFLWGENSTLHKWGIAADGTMRYLAESRETASYQTPGMTGGMCSLSSNHGAVGTAILWCVIPADDANATLTQGRLLAYDAESYSFDPDGAHLIKLWDSGDWGIGFRMNKFCPPVIWDGEVILPQYDGGVMVFTQ